MRVAYVGGMLIHPVAVLIAMATTVGSWVFLVCGAALALAASALVATMSFPWLGAFTGAGIGAAFATLLFVNARRPSVA